MSSKQQVRFTRDRESSYGVAPGAAMDEVRRVSVDGDEQDEIQPSESVRSDLQTVEVHRLDREASLQVEGEWVYALWNAFIEEALKSTLSTALAIDGAAGDISAVASGNKFTSTTADKFNSMVAGQIFRSFGFTNEANNGPMRVVSVVTGGSPEVVVAGATLTDETPAGAAVSFRGQYVRNGTSKLSAVFEEEFTDLSNEFLAFLGMVCNSWEWSFSHPGDMRTRFGYVGKEAVPGTATVGNGTVNPFAVQTIMNSSDHWGSVLEGGVALSPRVREFNLNVDWPILLERGAGSLGPQEYTLDKPTITGGLSVYNNAAARALVDKRRALTSTSFEWLTTDGSDQMVHFYLPAIKFSAGQQREDGERIMVPLEFIAERDATLDFMLQISVLPATA